MHHGDAEDRMLAKKAIQRCWPVDDAVRAELIGRLLDAARKPDASVRQLTAITKTVLAADRQSTVATLAAGRLREQDEFEERLARLEGEIREERRDGHPFGSNGSGPHGPRTRSPQWDDGP
jgi:hypothetical protein